MPWMCTHPCQAALACSHPCTSTCGKCMEGWVCQQLGLGVPALPSLDTVQQGSSLTVRLPGARRQLELPAPSQCTHAGCRQACGRTLFCGHACDSKCHPAGQCPPCGKRCPVRCVHSMCRKKCGECCPPCAEPCPWQCRHQGACPMPCGAPCVRLPCDRRCEKRLPCGCQCPSICGERCPPPDFCTNHGNPDITVLDPLMMTERSVRELSQEELENDPLVCLPCGHAFPMSSIDMHLELEACERSTQDGGTELRGGYSKAADGSWAAPHVLPDSFSSGKTCMKCRAPVGQILRYGRLLNKHGVDAAERKFMQQTDLQLQQADRQLSSLSQRTAAATGAGGGDASRSGDRGARRRVLRQLQGEAEKLLVGCKEVVGRTAEPPTLLVHHTARATVLRLADERQLAGGEAEELLHQLVVPHPDISPPLRALLLRSQCCVELAQLYTAELSMCEDELSRLGRRPAPAAAAALGRGGRGGRGGGQDPGSQAGHLSSRISTLSPLLSKHFASGHKSVQLAVKLAEDRGAVRFQISALRSQAQLLMSRAVSLLAQHGDSVAQALGQAPAMHRAAVEGEKRRVLDEADRALLGALRLLQLIHPAARGELPDELEGMRSKVESLRSMLTEAEKDDIVAALVGKDQGLAGRGYTGTGHFNRCRCGYLYIIGNCGGAVQTASCPSCGRAIGGTGHRLAEGNTPDTDFFQRAARVQHH